MSAVIILVVVALLVAIGLRQAVRGFAAEVIDPEQLLGRTHPVDLVAFRNLINPEEDAFLAARLSRTALWRVRRARYSAASDYVQVAARNAAVLVRLGQTAKNSTEVHIRDAGTKLLTVAIQTRLLAGIAIVQFQIARVLPWWQPSIRPLMQSYTVARAALESVVIWQRPDLAGRLSEAV